MSDKIDDLEPNPKQTQSYLEGLVQQDPSVATIIRSGSVSISVVSLLNSTRKLDDITIRWVSPDAKCYGLTSSCWKTVKKLRRLSRNAYYGDEDRTTLIIMIGDFTSEVHKLIELSRELGGVKESEQDQEQRQTFCSEVSTFLALVNRCEEVFKPKNELYYSLEYLERDHKKTFHETVGFFFEFVQRASDYKEAIEEGGTQEFGDSISELLVAKEKFKRCYYFKSINLDTMKILNDLLLGFMGSIVLVSNVQNHNIQPQAVKARMARDIQEVTEKGEKAVEIIKARDSLGWGISLFTGLLFGVSLIVAGAMDLQGELSIFDLYRGWIIIGVGVNVIFWMTMRVAWKFF